MLGKLVRLTTRPRAEARTRAGTDVPGAEIMLFTGVRYERRPADAAPDVTPDAPKAGAGGGSKRRRG